MKKYIILFVVTFSSYSYSQQIFELKGSSIYIANINGESSLETEGSQYLDENYKKASVDNGKADFLLRFNAYSNSFEYKNEDSVIKLDKIYKEILFTNNVFFKLISYKNFKKEEFHNVYLEEVKNSNSIVYKNHKIKFNPAVESVSSYEKAKPAKYVFTKPSYVVKYKESYYEIPEKTKDLEKLFPEKSAEIKAFVKQNKLKLTKEEDVIKFANFINN